MQRKKQLLKLKSLLVSSSILALTSVLTVNNITYATNRTSQNATSEINDAADWLDDLLNPGAVQNDDNIIFGGNHKIVMNVNNRRIAKFDTTGQGIVGNIEVSKNCFIGDVIGTGGSTEIKYLTNRNVRLNKTNYSKLAAIDFNGQNAQLRFQTGANNTKFNSAIVSNGNEVGRVRLESNVTGIEFTGDFSGTNLRQLRIDNNADAIVNASNGKLKGREVQIHQGATLTTFTDFELSRDINLDDNAGGTLIVEDGVDIKARNIRARTVGIIVGLVKFNKAATVESKFGDTDRAIANVEIGTGSVSINTDIYNVQNTKFTDAAGSLIMNKNQAFNFTNTTLSSTAGNDAGTLVFDTGNTTTIGATFNNIAGQKVNKLVVKNNSKIILDTEIHLGDKLDLENGGKVEVNDGKNINAKDISPVAVDTGEIDFLGISEISTNIGKGVSVKQVKISSKEVNFRGDEYNVTNTILPTVTSIINFTKDAPLTVNTKFSSGGGGDSGRVEVNSSNFATTFDGEFSNTPGDRIAEFRVSSTSIAILNTDLNVANDITVGDGSTLIVGKDKNITAQKIVGTKGAGTLIYLGKSKAEYELDSDFEQIEIRDGQVDFEGSKIKTDTLDFTSQNATIKLGNTNPQVDITGDIRNISGNDNAGNIIIDTKFNLTGKLGEAANRLNSINFAGDHEFKTALTELHVNKITTAVNGAGQLILTSKDPNKEFSSDIGTSTNKLKLLEFVAGLKVKANKMIHANTVFLKSQAGPLIKEQL
ncbi:MAG: hypothetical protein HRU35_01280 [Rickettsiaceae bacterium]|nr:hypothetical protein [Rickettsiaceae bacterium]